MPEFNVSPDSRVWFYKPETQKQVQMKPTDFLRLTGEPFPDSFRESPAFSRDAYDSVRGALERGEPMHDPPFLDVDVDTGEVVEHEGRHRALAAHDLGILRIPVVLFARRGFGRDREYPNADELRGVTLHPRGLRHIKVGPFRRPRELRRRPVKVKSHLRRRVVHHLNHPPDACLCRRSKAVDRARRGLARRLR